eukprot:2819186-Ditylum_brightwellii.AAC.1
MKQPGGKDGSKISNVGVEVLISPGSSSNNGGATLNPPRPTLSPNTKEEEICFMLSMLLSSSAD